jgi:hypothetical protein
MSASRLPTIIRGLSAIISAAGVVGVSIVFAFAWFYSHLAQTTIAAIKAAGDPTTIADLRHASVPPSLNAATFLREGKSEIEAASRQLQPIMEKPSYRDGPLGPCDDIAALFASRPGLTPLLENAASCPDCDLEADHAHGLQALESSLENSRVPVRHAASLLGARARLFSAKGDQERAVKTCLLIFRLADHAQSEPLLVDFLLGAGCRGVAIHTANLVLRWGAISNDTRNYLEKELRRQDGTAAYQRALKSERAYTIDGLYGGQNWAFRVEYAADLARYLELIDQQVSVAGQCYTQAVARARQETPRGLLPPFFSGLVFEPIMKVRIAKDRVLAEVRCLRVLNALQRKSSHEHAAIVLDTLGLPADAIVDPFSGASLIVKLVSGDWLIYSVGENQVDDGGDIAHHKDFGLGPIPAPTAASSTEPKG